MPGHSLQFTVKYEVLQITKYLIIISLSTVRLCRIGCIEYDHMIIYILYIWSYDHIYTIYHYDRLSVTRWLMQLGVTLRTRRHMFKTNEQWKFHPEDTFLLLTVRSYKYSDLSSEKTYRFLITFPRHRSWYNLKNIFNYLIISILML
jgi:hypothetical protein